MPIYEYRCENCGDFEETQRISDPPLQRCPKCRRKVRRLISNTSFQLKGSGWYVTDYARGSGNGGGKSGSQSGSQTAETKSDAGANGGTKSETKSESKADAKPAPSSTDKS